MWQIDKLHLSREKNFNRGKEIWYGKVEQANVTCVCLRVCLVCW